MWGRLGNDFKRGKREKNQLIKTMIMSVFFCWKYVIHPAPTGLSWGVADLLIRPGDLAEVR